MQQVHSVADLRRLRRVPAAAPRVRHFPPLLQQAVTLFTPPAREAIRRPSCVQPPNGLTDDLESIAQCCPVLPSIAQYCPKLPNIAQHCPTLPEVHCALTVLIARLYGGV